MRKLIIYFTVLISGISSGRSECGVPLEEIQCFPWVESKVLQGAISYEIFTVNAGYSSLLNSDVIRIAYWTNSGFSIERSLIELYDCSGNLLESCQLENFSNSSCTFGNGAIDLSFQDNLEIWHSFNNIQDYPTCCSSIFSDFTYSINSMDVQFSDSSTGEVNFRAWNFGDGSAESFLTNPTHTYSSSGTYTVTLQVYNDCNEEEISTQQVVIESEGTPVLCKNWVRDRILQDFAMCGSDCNGTEFNAEFGTVAVDGIDYFYYRSLNNFNDCYAYEIYDECGLRVDYCTYCVGCLIPTTCYTNIVDANEVFNYSYTPLWQCPEQLPFCIPENCNIITNKVSALCLDKGTSDPTDDLYLLTYEVNNSQGTGDYYLGIDGISDLTQIAYGGNSAISIDADGLPHLITFTDVEDQSCCITIETDSLKSCSIQNCDFNCISPTFNLVTAPLNIGLNDFIPTAGPNCGFSFRRDILDPNYYLDCRYLKVNQQEEDSLYIYQLAAGSMAILDSCLINFTIVNDGACSCTHPDYGPLMALYHSTGGDAWNNNNGWRDGASGMDCDPCGWYGIACENNRVTSLELSWNDLTGKIPQKLDSLSQMQYLHFRGNNLYGSIPPELGSLQNLEELDLAENILSGVIPPELGNLQNLKELDFRVNKLNGVIPPELGNLSQLITLYLFVNDLTGIIPSELGQLDQLLRLGLDRNDLTGTIPLELGNLQNLESLALSSNNLNGDIPPSFSGLTELTNLYLNNNQLSGCYDLDLLNLCSLQFLDFSNNSLLPWQGDFTQFCATPDMQIGAPCQLNSGEMGTINVDCECRSLQLDTVDLVFELNSVRDDTLIYNFFLENITQVSSLVFNIEYDTTKVRYLKNVPVDSEFEDGYLENTMYPGKIRSLFIPLNFIYNLPNDYLIQFYFLSSETSCENQPKLIDTLKFESIARTEVNDGTFRFRDHKIFNRCLGSPCSEDEFIIDYGDGYVCSGSPLLISVELANGGQDSIVLRPRDNPLVDGAVEIVGRSPLQNIALDLMTTSTNIEPWQEYDVYKLGEENCSSDTMIRFGVLPELFLDAIEDIETCIGEELIISPNVSGGQESYSYYWYTADDSLTINETLDILVEEDLEIFVLVEDFYGHACIERDTFSIIVQPDIDFSLFMCEPSTDEVTFTWSPSFDDVSFTVLSGQTSTTQANSTTLTINQLLPEEEVRVAFEVTQGCLVQSDTIICSALLCPAVDLMIIAPSELCIDDLPIEYANNQNTNPDLKSGTYSTDLGNSGVFDPMEFGVGVHKVWYVTVSVPECIYSDTIEIEVLAPPADEYFDVIELCAEDLASYSSTADPNGDGVFGWQGGQALVFGFNGVVVSNGVCDYQQVLEIVEILENDCNPCDHPDFSALMALYDSTKGSEWNNNSGWKEGAEGTSCDPCSWSGITCKNGRVSEIRFISRGLKGILPNEIGQLDSIERLEIRRDSLFGNIPVSISNLKQLEYLSLRDNYLSGEIPPTITLLPNLKQLRLTLNNLSGELPIDYSESLEVLLASSNDFSGPIPEQLSSAKALSILGLGGNQLSGKIPFASLQTLKDLNLSRNNLTGTIEGIQNLTNLEGINLFQNQLSGNIPFEIGELKKLTYLNLFTNNFFGEIPSSISDLDSIILIQLYENNLTGEIPKGVFDLPKLEFLYLSGNNFEGCITIGGEFICNRIQNDLNDTIRIRDEISIFYDLTASGFDLRNNPLLPWQGDMTEFCAGKDQTGAPCLLNETEGAINDDCICELRNECDFKLADDFLSGTIGDANSINLISNDVLPDSFSLVDQGFSDSDVIPDYLFDEYGVLSFEIVGSFYDTIFFNYEVCDLSCNECRTAQLKITNFDLEDIIQTNFLSKSDANLSVLKFTSSDGMDESNLWIYNRWGDLIYKSENYSNDWSADGYPAGIYYYVLEVRGVTIKKTLTILD